jgi:pimeloyl-ACP methyl ester carboxylesterase
MEKTLMKINDKLFKKVPQQQYSMLKQFIEDHQYKIYQNNGRNYEYLSIGNGSRTIVFIHGAMFNPYMWFYSITKLKNYFRIIAPKLPAIGMGANDSVNYIKTILDIENIDKAIILGYSYGGGVAQYFAEVHPDNLDILILSHTGILRREDSIFRTQKMLRKLKILPSFLIQIIKFIRTRSGKESEWYRFRKAFFNWTFSSITKKDFVNHFKMNLIFFREIQHLPVGRVSWKGKTLILATESDKDTFQYYDKLTSIYNNNENYVFDEPGGHHMLFLYPEKYTNILNDLLQRTDRVV